MKEKKCLICGDEILADKKGDVCIYCSVDIWKKVNYLLGVMPTVMTTIINRKKHKK